MLPTASNNTITHVIYEGKSVNCSASLTYSLQFENNSGVTTIASFMLSDGSTTPYILSQKIGTGTIVFADFSIIDQLPTLQKDTVLDLTKQILTKLLPASKPVTTPQKLPIPSQIFEPITFRGSTYDLWRNTDLRNNILFHDGITGKGDFSISSDYLESKCNSLYISDMTINGVNLLTNISIYEVRILGSGGFHLAAQLNYPILHWDFMT